VEDLGFAPNELVWEYQKKLHTLRHKQKIEDTLLLVEHEPVYTLGKNADENHILHQPDKVKVYHIERGGDVTYHGPGQIVGYPILDLHNYRRSVSWYMRSLEEVLIRLINSYGVRAGRKPGLTGVWVGDKKIAALGVRLSRWVTMHGFALNVNTDLSYYQGIIPCGIFEYGVTSLEQCLGRSQDMGAVKTRLIQEFGNVFQIDTFVGVN
jgi:lipoate-protein ligase B